jgi:hypothetical protein
MTGNRAVWTAEDAPARPDACTFRMCTEAAAGRGKQYPGKMDIDEVDLDELAGLIRQRIPPGEPPVGYLRGRSYFRDLIVHELHCSEMEAENLVDTLEMNGYLHFDGDPAERSVADSRWEVLPHVP